jgi:hypothetical protein
MNKSIRIVLKPALKIKAEQARDVRARALRYALDCYFRKQQTTGASTEKTTVIEERRLA